MLNIKLWTECGDKLDCDMSRKCRYGKSHYLYHNISVEIHRFFQYKLHIKLPHLLYFGSEYERLSGTDKCPHHKSRHYTCWDCKYMYGLDYCEIPSNERIKDFEDTDWNQSGRCGSFEKCGWADDYRRDVY